MSEKEILKENIKKENNLNKVILNLTQLEENKDRLLEMLQSINIGEKRIYNSQLETFIKSSPELKEEEREEYLTLINENQQICDEIEKQVVEKLGLEVKQTETTKNKRHEKKKDFEDFHESFVNLSLVSSLESISTSHRIIQQEIENLKITPQNVDRVTSLLNKTEAESIDWLKYLTEQKKNGNFTLLEDKILDLYDVTIAETQKTLKMVESTKEKIAKGTKGEDEGEKRTDTTREVEDSER